MQLSPMRRRTNITFSLFPRWWNSRCAWLANNDPAAVEALFAGFPVRPLPVRPETGVGVIFDDRGHRMSPTYTVRRRNRYRYYISQAQLRGGEPGSRPRIGADEVEQLVVQALCRQRGRDDQITDVASGAWSAEIRELVRTMVDRIVICHDGIEIALKRNAINRAGGFIDG